MRIWSIHPKYLDTKRLTAQWREALLCKSILEGKTNAYTRHPQYLRLINSPEPYQFINAFLLTIWDESKKRGYKYNIDKIDMEQAMSFGKNDNCYISVTNEQLEYEFCHILNKVLNNKQFDINKTYLIEDKNVIENLVFKKVKGSIMDYEIIKEETIKIKKSLFF